MLIKNHATLKFMEINEVQLALTTGKVACQALRERAAFENRSASLYDEWIDEMEKALKLMAEKSDEAVFGRKA